MICPPCIEAGEYNRRANLALDPVRVADRRKIAASYHRQCQSPNCTCQHFVGGNVLKGASDG